MHPRESAEQSFWCLHLSASFGGCFADFVRRKHSTVNEWGVAWEFWEADFRVWGDLGSCRTWGRVLTNGPPRNQLSYIRTQEGIII